MTPSSRPQVSLVIPLQDEETTIDALLGSIEAQSLRPDELVLVDAGSRDATLTHIRRFGGAVPTVVVEAGRIFPGIARNVGVHHARYGWIAFTDGGVTLARQWLEELLKRVEPGVDVVLGAFDPVCSNFLTECAAIAYVPRRRPDGLRSPSVASIAISRRAFEVVGGFPPYRAAEDLVFLECVRQKLTCREAPQALIHWQLAGSVRATFRRFSEYSFHNLAAGRGRYWHWGVVRLYAALGLSLTVAVLHYWGWWSSLLVPSFFLGRTAKAAWTKRHSFPFETLSVKRITGAAALLVVIDAATATGLLKWVRSTVRGEQPYRPGEPESHQR